MESESEESFVVLSQADDQARSLAVANPGAPLDIQEKLNNLMKENVNLKETLQQNNEAMRRQFSTLVAWQDDVMTVHETHKAKFEQVKQLVTKLQMENYELKEHVGDLQARLDQTERRRSDADSLKESLNKQANSLKSLLESRDETISRLEKETDELKDRLQQLQIDSDSVPILKAQLDVYQSDFGEESRARLEAVRERDGLLADIRALQQRNEELTKELDSLRGNPSTEASPPQTLVSFACPICDSRFQTFHLLRNHVEECLGSSASS